MTNLRERDSGSQLMRNTLLGMSMNFILARAIHVAASLGIADALVNGARTAEDLARENGTHAPSLRRLMRALTTCGVFTELEYGCYALNAQSRLLCRDAPDSVRDFVLYLGCEWQTDAWSDLLGTVRTGLSYPRRYTGLAVFDHFAADAAVGQLFERSMTESTAAHAQAIASHCNLNGARVIADIGGGDGTLLAAFLSRNPDARGILVERGSCIAAAREAFRGGALASRCEFIEADIFSDAWPAADAYLLKNVLHDWDDSSATQILRIGRQSVALASTLFIIEALLGSGRIRPHEAFMDLSMLLLTGGRERSEAEFRALLGDTGFNLAKATQTGTPFVVLEATADVRSP